MDALNSDESALIRFAAVHEIGRAVVAHRLNFGQLFCVTVRPERGRLLMVEPDGAIVGMHDLSLFGFTGLILADDEKYPQSETLAKQKITVLLAGAAAQELLFHKMVDASKVQSDRNEASLLAKRIGGAKAISMMMDCYKKALAILKDNVLLLQQAVDELIANETLLAADLAAILPTAIVAAEAPLPEAL